MYTVRKDSRVFSTDGNNLGAAEGCWIQRRGGERKTKDLPLDQKTPRSCEMQLSWVRLRFQSGLRCNASKALDFWSPFILAEGVMMTKLW